MVTMKNSKIDDVVDYDALNLWDEGRPITKLFYDMAKGVHLKPEPYQAGIFQGVLTDLEIFITEAMDEPTFQNGMALGLALRDYNSVDSFHACILRVLNKEMKFVGESYVYSSGAQVSANQIVNDAKGFVSGVYDIVSRSYEAPDDSSLDAIFGYGFKMVRSVMLLCTANKYELFEKLIEHSVETFHQIQHEDLFDDESPTDKAKKLSDRIDFKEED